MTRKQKALRDESLSWIDQTGASGELEVLKEYVSEEEEQKKSEASDMSSLYHDDSSTIVKKTKGDKHPEEKSEEKQSAAEDTEEDINEIEKIVSKKEEAKNINAMNKKIPEKISYEKLKAKTADAFGTVKKQGVQAVDAISKVFGPEKLNIKKMADSIISACSQPLGSLSSIDRNINNSAKKIIQFKDKNIIDKNVMKPIKNLDASINHEIKRILATIL